MVGVRPVETCERSSGFCHFLTLNSRRTSPFLRPPPNKSRSGTDRDPVVRPPELRLGHPLPVPLSKKERREDLSPPYPGPLPSKEVPPRDRVTDETPCLTSHTTYVRKRTGDRRSRHSPSLWRPFLPFLPTLPPLSDERNPLFLSPT